MEQLALALWASLCGYQDSKHLRVSNLLTFGGFLIALVYLYAKQSSLTGNTVSMAIGASFIGIALSLPGYLSGRLGAADVKFMAALGLASDPLTLLYSLASGCLICMLCVLGKSYARPMRTARTGEERTTGAKPSKNKSFPFVFAMNAGFLASLIIDKTI